jgi:hypothetical protein
MSDRNQGSERRVRGADREGQPHRYPEGSQQESDAAKEA